MFVADYSSISFSSHIRQRKKNEGAKRLGFVDSKDYEDLMSATLYPNWQAQFDHDQTRPSG